jgi:hypothetical protein
MLDPHEAARKVAAASFALSRARQASSSPKAVRELKAAEQRLRFLLRIFVKFKDHAEFRAAYRHEMDALRATNLACEK